MFSTDGPTPVSFTSGGKEYTIQTTVLNGRNIPLIKAELQRRAQSNGKVYTDNDAVDTLNESEWIPFHLELNCGIKNEEARAIYERENVFEMKELLIEASGWRHIQKNLISALVEEEKLLESLQPKKTTAPSQSVTTGPTTK